GVKCWGDNSNFQTTVPNDLKGVTQLAAGLDHTCTWGAQGLRCWGSNLYSQSILARPSSPQEVVAANSFTLVRNADGWKCWGAECPTTDELKDLKKVVGGPFTCFMYDTSVKCKGSNDAGQLKVPEGLKHVKDIAITYQAGYVIDEEELKSWGAP